MPANWTTLPVHHGPWSTGQRETIAVYTKDRRDRSLVYEGFICPSAPETVPMSFLQQPPRQKGFAKKYAKLLEKIKVKEEEAEAQRKIIPEDEDSAASSKLEQGVVEKESSAVPGHVDTADELKTEASSDSKNKPEKIYLSGRRMESNNNYPLPEELIERRESIFLFEGGIEEFSCCFEPWDDTTDIEFLKSLYAEPYPAEQSGSLRPDFTYHTLDSG